MPKPLKTKIEELEAAAGHLKNIIQQFPDASINSDGSIHSAMVNQCYNETTFTNTRYYLYMQLFYNHSYALNNKEHSIRIYSKNKQSYRLLSIGFDFTNGKDKKTTYTINFADYVKDFKKHKVREGTLIDDCRNEIIAFIKNNPNYKINETNLEPRLKKLLIFS